MLRTHLLIFLSVLPAIPSFSQRIDQTALYRQLSDSIYYRIHYENDFFVASDEYYTQGMQVEFVHPGLRKNPLSYALLRFPDNRRFGLALEHNAYSPTTILSDSILLEDRPYAADFMLKSFLVSTDTTRRMRLTNSWTLGVIGPAAFAHEMQKAIHRMTGNYIPLGWQYQIRNDLVLNYDLSFEKMLLAFGRVFTLSSDTRLRVGTLNDKIQVGFTAMLGKIPSLLLLPKRTRDRFSMYLYSQPLLSVVGYDATLQGGVFNRSSPHIINASQIERFTFENNAGLVIRYRNFQAEGFVGVITRELGTGKGHRWGGIKLSIGFR